MRKPPSWLPWLGPVMAGIGAGLAGTLLGADFWGSLFAALVVGFLPIIVYRVWVWRVRRRG
jgi:predicted lipid-binding transport protein (Tim44 family)